ncbi:MAG: type II secretion system GspH family protein [Rickettsiales bacterium]|jgi:prepilin-type N-terminal cleavage/methylation domain-containing protein|nr:type II secretion system GspH family protein [Rickettsiales bacterium]
MKKYDKGFTLVEMSLVLAISAILLVGALDITRAVRSMTSQNDTAQKLRVIEKAINAYILEHRKLPCPAGMKLTTKSANYGKEACSPSVGDGITQAKKNSLLVGTIPVDDLNLERRYLFDGWNNKFVYLVLKDYTGDENNLFSKAIDSSELINLKFSYVLISHGRNKIGGVHYDDSAENLNFINNATDGEKKNIFSLIGDTIQEFKDTQKFDDIVFAQNKENIIQSLDIMDTGCLTEGYSVSVNDKCGYGFSFSDLPTYINYREKRYSNTQTVEKDKVAVEVRCTLECGSYGNLNVYPTTKEL